MVCNRKTGSQWLMLRRIGGCDHYRVVEVGGPDRQLAAHLLRMARASLRVACEQQRVAMRRGGW